MHHLQKPQFTWKQLQIVVIFKLVAVLKLLTWLINK